MNKEIIKQEKKIRRVKRARAKIFGTAIRPRLSVNKTNANIFAQIIDDDEGKTLASAHTKEITTKGTKSEIAMELGKLIAKKGLEKNVKQVRFDRRGSRFHGRIKAVADGAREGGLEF